MLWQTHALYNQLMIYNSDLKYVLLSLFIWCEIKCSIKTDFASKLLFYNAWYDCIIPGNTPPKKLLSLRGFNWNRLHCLNQSFQTFNTTYRLRKYLPLRVFWQTFKSSSVGWPCAAQEAGLFPLRRYILVHYCWVLNRSSSRVRAHLVEKC